MSDKDSKIVMFVGILITLGIVVLLLASTFFMSSGGWPLAIVWVWPLLSAIESTKEYVARKYRAYRFNHDPEYKAYRDYLNRYNKDGK